MRLRELETEGMGLIGNDGSRSVAWRRRDATGTPSGKGNQRIQWIAVRLDHLLHALCRLLFGE